MMAEHLVGRLEDLPERQAVLLKVGETTIGVFKVKGQVHAYENRCVHAGGPVCQGEILGRFEHVLGPDKTVQGERFSEEEFHLICPWHGWEFNLESGVCTSDGKFRLRSFQTMVRGGAVYVQV